MFIVKDKQAKLGPYCTRKFLMDGYHSLRFTFLLPVALFSMLLISGCGKKGPLYLPQKGGQEQAVPKPSPDYQP